MRKFNFRLQSVQGARMVVESQKRGDLVSATEKMRAAEAETNDRIDALRTDAAHTTGPKRVGDLLAGREQFERHHRAIDVALETQRSATELAQVAHVSWSQANQAVKVLERLEDKDRSQWRVHTNREDQKVTDEVAQNRRAGRRI